MSIQYNSARRNIISEQQGVLLFKRYLLGHNFTPFDWPLENDNGVDVIGIASLPPSELTPTSTRYTPVATSLLAGFQLKSSSERDKPQDIPVGKHKDYWMHGSLPIFLVNVLNKTNSIYIEDAISALQDDNLDSVTVDTRIDEPDGLLVIQHVWARTVAWSLCPSLGRTLRKRTLRDIKNYQGPNSQTDPVSPSVWSFIANSFFSGDGLMIRSWNENYSFFKFMDVMFLNDDLRKDFIAQISNVDEEKNSYTPSNVFGVLYVLIEMYTDFGRFQIEINSDSEKELSYREKEISFCFNTLCSYIDCAVGSFKERDSNNAAERFFKDLIKYTYGSIYNMADHSVKDEANAWTVLFDMKKVVSNILSTQALHQELKEACENSIKAKYSRILNMSAIEASQW